MQAWPTAHRNDQLTHKWCELVRRRRDHFIELYKTGRWKHYYTEAEFLAQLQQAVGAAAEWEKLAARSQARQVS